jgi:aminopeptidase N
MSSRIGAVALVLLLISSCSTSRKTAKISSVEQNLDTVEITASRENPYRGSADKNFDLQDTKLEVKFDYIKQYLYGKATLTLKPHFYTQHELTLDAKQFDIHEVSLVTGPNNREALHFSYDSLQLKILLNKTYTRDETIKIYIDYAAKPNERKTGGSAAITEDKGLYFINPLGLDSTKPTQIWTQGETESNSCWFPTIDKPNQKMTEEIYITHLRKYVSLSNGVLVNSTIINDSLVTDHWKSDLPFAPYLVMMAIGNYSIIHDRWRDVPVDYYVEKDYAPYAKLIFGKTPQMMEFFSEKLGFDFPWPKYSQVVVRDYVSGAMENTSATVHGEFMQRTPRELLDETYEEVISHELFHQWFGDLVTPESWSNIPLNESFATYGEYLWNEYKYGREYADYKQRTDYRKYMTEAGEKNADLIRYYYNDREDMFDAISYEKGGMVLHYLRSVLGDDAFFKSLELYLKTNQFKTVEIDNLRMAFEEVTGKDLHWFFNEWFFNTGHPELNIHYKYTADSVYVSIDQKHNIGKDLTYRLPFKLAVWYDKAPVNYDFVLSKKSQTFAFKADGKPLLIDFDPEHEVLCDRKDDKTTDNYIFEYNNARFYTERIEALKNLAPLQAQNAGAKAALIKAMTEDFFAVREFAVGKIDLPKDNNDSIYITLLNLAQHDKASSVRSAAIKKLAKAPDPSFFTSLFEKGTADSSIDVTASALDALDEANGKKAMEIATQLQNDKSADIVAAVADVYSKEGDSAYQAYFENKLRHTSGVGKYELFFYYANFLTRMDKSMVLNGIKTIEQEGATSNSHFLLGGAKGALKRISVSFDDKKRKAQSDMAAESGKTGKLELQEQIAAYDDIISSAKDALNVLGKSNSKQEE